MKSIRLPLAIAAVAALLAGCGHITRPLITEKVVSVPARVQTNLTTVAQPAQVQVTAQDVGGKTVFVTNVVQLPPLVVTNTVFVPASNYTVSITNGFEVNPALAGGITTAQQLNSTLNPTPAAPIVNIALGLLGAGAGLFARYQTRRLKEAESKGRSVAVTLVENFEVLRKEAQKLPQWTAEVDHKVMDAVKAAQAMAGVKTDIHNIVEEVTENTI
jgi:hypothetical protein